MSAGGQVIFPHDSRALDALEMAFSSDRLAGYSALAGGNRNNGLRLYAMNTALSEALYTSLQTLEITLRNSLHNQLSIKFGSEWFNNQDFRNYLCSDERELERIDVAKKYLEEKRKTADGSRVVAELSFSFWTTLLNNRYENTLWRLCLRKAFPRIKTLVRKKAHGQFNRARLLRNRIAHHEPVLDRDLLADHEIILNLVGWMSPEARCWAEHHSRFTEVHSRFLELRQNLNDG